jgi:hypothetical protein
VPRKGTHRKNDEHRKRIQEYEDRESLKGLWLEIKAGRASAWPNGRALEYLVIRLCELEGAEVRYPFENRGRAEQLDGAVYFRSAGLSLLVETKDYSSDPVAVDPIAKLFARLQTRPPLVMGALFTTSSFTPGAVDLAGRLLPLRVLLWSGRDLEVALQMTEGLTKGMWQKYRYAVETGLPDYNLNREGMR